MVILRQQCFKISLNEQEKINLNYCDAWKGIKDRKDKILVQKDFFFSKETEILYFPLKYLSTCGCHGVYKEFQLRRNILGLSKEDLAVSLKRN